METYRVWCEPMHRANPRVTAADIEKAIAWYQEATGYMPTVIMLNTKLAGLPVPEGVELKTIGGCLVYEVWLSGNGRKTAPPIISNAAEKPHAAKIGCDTTKVVEVVAPVNVTGSLTAKIRQLAGQGLSCRSIEKKLSTAGVTMSYRTIHRWLRSDGIKRRRKELVGPRLF